MGDLPRPTGARRVPEPLQWLGQFVRDSATRWGKIQVRSKREHFSLMDLRIHITILVTVARCTGSLVGTLTSTLLAVNRTLNVHFMAGAASQLTVTCTNGKCCQSITIRRPGAPLCEDS
jgi:hypothetical protein